MIKEEFKKVREKLYKATPLTFQLVEELERKIINCLGNGVEVNGISLDSGFLNIGDLYVKRIEIVPNDIAHIMIHWYPNFELSTREDPYCSVYMLTEEEIRYLIEKTKTFKAYYLSHNKK